MEWAFLLVLLLSSGGKSEDHDDDDSGTVEQKPPEGMTALKFKAANLTEEDQHSMHMPQDLMCDGCKVIAYLATRRLNNVQGRYKKGHRLLESEVIDLFDEVCHNNAAFDGYGVKEVDGKKRLSGEGLETKDVPGVMQGGGKWPNRLRQMCEQYVGNLGEDLLYDTFLEKGSLEELLCYSEENENICEPKKKKKTKKAREDL
ncbi:hypothetical protein ACOMHN_020240 [Nucella lapillus]